MAELVKNFNNLPWASCKTRNGLAMANISTVNGIDVTADGGGDPDWLDVVLLLHCDGTDASTSFPDNSDSNHTVTAVGDAQVDTAQFKYGDASALFDGSGDSLSLSATADFAFGTGDFTLEFWMRTTDQTATLFALPSPASGYWDLILYANDFYWQTAYNSSNLYQKSAAAVTDGNWHHIACCRSGTDHRLFFDGTQQGATVTDSTDYNKSDVGMVIGNAGGVGGAYSGHLDDIRITKGTARYTSDFTAPTAAFPDF